MIVTRDATEFVAAVVEWRVPRASLQRHLHCRKERTQLPLPRMAEVFATAAVVVVVVEGDVSFQRYRECYFLSGKFVMPVASHSVLLVKMNFVAVAAEVQLQ